MVEPEDLLSKADALMARHRPQGTTADPYAGIPVLEEVVERQPDGDDLPVLTELIETAPVEINRLEPGLVEPELLREEQPEALAASIRASLLDGLQPRIDALIEERLRDGLSPLVERMFHELRGDLQLLAREILGDALHSAVEQELERRKSRR